MSETDDTDVLLLIPPDFFLVRSSGSEDSLLESSRTVVHKPPSCTAQVIGKLVDQVHSLESRLETLEINTTITDSSLGSVPRPKNWDSDSLDSKSFDNKYFTFPRRRRRKSLKKVRHRDLSLTSLDSHSTRPSIPRLKLQDFELVSLRSKNTGTLNDSKSMDGDLSSIVSTPSKKNDKLLLNEIDEFLTKVESYEAPESTYKDLESPISPGNVIKATGNYILNKLDSKNKDNKLTCEKTASTSVLDKYIYLVKSNPQSVTRSDMDLPSTSALKTHENEESLDHPSILKETPKPTDNTLKSNTETKSPTIRKLNFSDKEVQPTSTPKKPLNTLTDSFKPSTNKIYDRASKVLEQYKSHSSRTQNSLTDSYLKEDFKMPQMRPFIGSKESFKNKFMESIDTDLLSLSDLWGERADKDRGDSSKLEEERLKREHCEAMIQQLQKKLLDQQERLAVAIKVDRAKDNAIAKLKDSWLRLTGTLDKSEERHREELDKIMREVDHYKQMASEAQKKTNHFEGELYKALDLAHDYQEKCKQLMSRNKEAQEHMDRALSLKGEELANKDKQLKGLQDNYETMMRLNKQSTDCVKNLEEALEKEKADQETSKAKIAELLHKIQSVEDDSSLLRSERDLLREKLNEERSRADILEKQMADKHNFCSDLLTKCDNLDCEVKSLRKALELQKNELKTHYQKQLEDAVLAKLQEFQQQLDMAEREMENEARVKETHIVDTYNKQIARIEEQHKLEINVLEEKQREEIKLYRLQLAQSSEKIGLLENKLESYRRRRGQIASQLHSVMEAQWRQALLILTSGHPSTADLTLNTRPDTTVSTPGATDYGPPQIPPLTLPPDKRLQRPAPLDAFNFEGLSDHELQQYVKLLLTKPAHVDVSGGGGGGGDTAGGGGVTDLSEEPTSDRPDRERRKRSLGNKPPWKA